MSATRTARDVKPDAPTRDQATSSFTRILERLRIATPGSAGVALVDFEGETVDYAGRFDPYELKVAAAHWLIVLSEIRARSRAEPSAKSSVRARGRSYVVRCLEENYAVVVVLHPRAAFAVSERAIQQAVAGLSVEAGWTAPRESTRWFGVQVETAPRDRRAARSASRSPTSGSPSR